MALGAQVFGTERSSVAVLGNLNLIARPGTRRANLRAIQTDGEEAENALPFTQHQVRETESTASTFLLRVHFSPRH